MQIVIQQLIQDLATISQRFKAARAEDNMIFIKKFNRSSNKLMLTCNHYSTIKTPFQNKNISMHKNCNVCHL